MNIAALVEKIAGDISLDQPIYRYMSFDRFLKNLDTDSDVFTLPLEWCDLDPFEDFISKAMSPLGNGFNVTNDLFAQCWNTGHECDGMWKNYAGSDLKNGVMIQSSVRCVLTNLIEFFMQTNLFSDQDLYQSNADIENQIISMLELNDVKYYPVNKIVGQFETYFDAVDKLAHGLNNDEEMAFLTHVSSLLSIKREHYSYEKELRFFIQLYGKQKDAFKLVNGNRVLIPGFASRVIRVYASPKMSEYQFECYKNRLVDKYGFDAEHIQKSKMYDVELLLKNSKLQVKK